MKLGLLFFTLLFCFQPAIAEKQASFFDYIKQLYETDGINVVIKEIEVQHKFASTIYKFNLDQLNQLGYELLSKNKADDAIQLFLLNIKYYPDSWGIKDSLAEGYLHAGKLQQSLKQYQYTFSLLGLTEHDNWDRKWTIGQLEKVYTKMEKPDAILPLYQQEVDLNPYADWALQRIGEVLLERGDQAQGIDYLYQATELQASPDKAW
ncbi:MAG: hypothetical protein KAU21_08080, partial [Gammaproteobacteria bacterium]|nr:hypothetical protein [Gammaproteobacteria bacterium]